MTTVKEVMTGKVISVEASTPAIAVVQRMKASRTWIIPVCDNGKFRGVITERDFVIGIIVAERNPNTVPASSLMNRSWPIISPGDDIWHAINVMAQNGVQILPVVQNGNLIGLLSLDNLGQRSPALAAVVFSKTIISGFWGSLRVKRADSAMAQFAPVAKEKARAMTNKVYVLLNIREDNDRRIFSQALS